MFFSYDLQGSSKTFDTKTLYKCKKLFTNLKNFIQKFSSTYLAKIKKLLTSFTSGEKIIAKIVDLVKFNKENDVNFTRNQENRKN